MTTQFSVAAALIHTEKLAVIGAARLLQLEWLDKIAVVTQRLRPHMHAAAALDQVEAASGSLRHQLALPGSSNDDISRRWLQIITGLLIATLGIDDRIDTGDLVEVFSQLVESCEAA